MTRTVMNKFFFLNKITSLIFAIFSNALCVLFFIVIAFVFLGKENFGYLTGLFILENILILFDLTINYYLIKRLSTANAISKSKIIIFFIKRIIIFNIIFLFFNIFFLKFFFWDKIVDNNINLSLFLTLVTTSVVITRIFINFFKTILIGNSDQIMIGKIQLISSLSKIIIFICFLFFFQTIKELLISYFFGFVIELVLYLRVILKKFKINLSFSKTYKLKKNYFSSIKNIFLFSLSLIIFFNIDRILLSYKSSGDIIGEYNFIKTILLGFFIISGGYFYTLLPDLFKVTNNTFIKEKIIKNIKSLNKILIFCVVLNLLYFENFFYDLKINLFINIENFSIFKIILLGTYLSILGQIFISFQIAKSYLKIPTIINYVIIILSLIFGNLIIVPYGMKDAAFLFLSINAFSLVLNVFFLNFRFKKIFTNIFISNVIKNIFYNYILSFFILITINQIFYSFSKILFYLIIIILLFYFFYLSQRNNSLIDNK
jgi:O-antigen/teichoic acid export membrane protein